MKVISEETLRIEGAVLVHPVKDLITTHYRIANNSNNKKSIQLYYFTDNTSINGKSGYGISSNSNTTTINSNLAIQLKILVISPTRCDSIVCIDYLGSNRINLGNYGSALKALGHEVTFMTG